jgi:transposase
MKYSKLSDYKIKKILQSFSLELTSVQTAHQLKLNRHTVDRYYEIFRERIAAYEEENMRKLSGNIEIDESYFGSRHIGDKRGRGAPNKIPVIGILKRKGKVYATVIPDVSSKTLVPIIEKLVANSKTNVFTDKWRSYDGLVLSGYKHHRINHSQEFVRSHNHINGIESFWSYVKRKMRKHNGIARHKFYLYLKESEFRFNNRGKNIYQLLKSIIFNNLFF